MKNRNIILLFLSIILAGCTEIIEVELDDTYTNLAVEGSITNRLKMQSVKISKTSNYFSNIPADKATGAEVSITEYDEDGSLLQIFNLTEYDPGLYLTEDNVCGFAGRTYKLDILLDGVEYTASSLMKSVTRIDSIEFYYDPEDDRKFLISLFAREPSTPGDNYMFSVYKDIFLETDTITELVFKNDNLINGKYIYDIIVQSVRGKVGNSITLKMSAITEEYYKYNIALLKEVLYNEGPFEAAPANIRGNLSNGALGFFAAVSETYYTKEIGSGGDK